MILDIDERDGWVVVATRGEVDLQHAPRLRKALTDSLLGGRGVIVDLSPVTFIDSSGIAALIEAYQMARTGGNAFILAAPSAPARRVLKLARLDTVFAIADSVTAATEGP